MKPYAHMTHTEKFDALMDVDKDKLVEQLLRAIRDSETLTRTKKLHFEDRPDNVARAYDFGALPTCEFDSDLSLRRDGELTHRLFIGDNIDALMGLAIAEAGTYDLIYIDPPYNTGKGDFTYNDRFVPEDDAWRHSKWLSFMEPRLRLAHELLSDTGVIFVAIDNNEHHHLRALMDSVFNEANFIGDVVWQGSRKNDSRFISDGVDYMLVFAKNKTGLIESDIKWRDEKSGYDDVIEAGRRAWTEGLHEASTAAFGRNDGSLKFGPTGSIIVSDAPTQREREVLSKASAIATAKMKAWWRSLPKDHPAKRDGGLKLYNMVDEKGVLRSDNLSWPGGGGPMYDLLHPVTGLPCKVPSRGWLATPETMAKWVADGLVLFGKDHTTVPQYKRYLDTVQGKVATSIIDVERLHARRHVEDIIGDAFTFPKDHNVLARWFRMTSPSNAKVLDFFAGSGTTAEAVLALNAEDGGTRTVTLVTNDEAGIGTNVTRERVARVMTGENWVKPEKAVALGGQLAVYRVGQTDSADDPSWAPSAAIWAASHRWPFVTNFEQGVMAFDSGGGDEFDAVASTQLFPEDPDGELAAINVAFYEANNDAAFLCVELADDLMRFPEGTEPIGAKQARRMTYLRRHAISEHSIDFNTQMQTLLSNNNESV